MGAFFASVGDKEVWRIGLAPAIGFPALSRKIGFLSLPTVMRWTSTDSSEELNTSGFPVGPVSGVSTSSILPALLKMTGSPWGPGCEARKLRNRFTPATGLQVWLMNTRLPPGSGGETSKNADESKTCAPPPQ